MRRTRLSAAIVLVALAAAAAAAACAVIALTIRDNGRTVRAHVGDTVVVRLAANPSTGYAWKLAQRGLPVLRVVSTRYVPPKAKPPRVGVPGTYVATFAVRAAGRGTLRLLYVRTTHPATPPAARFSVVVTAS